MVIVSGVAYSHSSVVLLLDICLGVANSSLDDSGRSGVSQVVGDFISSKEPNDIGVRGHSIDHRGVSVEQCGGPLWVGSINGVCRFTQVTDDIDSGGIQQGHALGVIRGRIDGISSDGVGSQLLELGNIASTAVNIGKRVGVLGLWSGS